MTNQIRMTNGGGRQSGVRDLRYQASSLPLKRVPFFPGNRKTEISIVYPMALR